MREADERRNASIITHSSTRLSSTGRHVGCTTNTSVPRMLSPIWNDTSVSGNRCSRAFPTGTPRKSAISFVSAGCALPENSFRAPWVIRSPLAARAACPESWLGRKDSNLRIREPKSRALPLGHAPSVRSALSSSRWGPSSPSACRPQDRSSGPKLVDRREYRRRRGPRAPLQIDKCIRSALFRQARGVRRTPGLTRASCSARERVRETSVRQPARSRPPAAAAAAAPDGKSPKTAEPEPDRPAVSAPCPMEIGLRPPDLGMPPGDRRLEVVPNRPGRQRPVRAERAGAGARPSTCPRRTSGTRPRWTPRSPAAPARGPFGGRSASGARRSPRPRPMAVPPSRKNGTSEPTSAAISARASGPSAPPQSRASKQMAAAASALPPPRPASAGTCFSSRSAAPSGTPGRPSRRQSAPAARQARLRASRGTPGASHASANGPGRASHVTTSWSAIDWNTVSRSWNPSGRTPVTRSSRLIFA